jgi:hypothetical protein
MSSLKVLTVFIFFKALSVIYQSTSNHLCKVGVIFLSLLCVLHILYSVKGIKLVQSNSGGGECH